MLGQHGHQFIGNRQERATITFTPMTDQFPPELTGFILEINPYGLIIQMHKDSKHIGLRFIPWHRIDYIDRTVPLVTKEGESDG